MANFSTPNDLIENARRLSWLELMALYEQNKEPTHILNQKETQNSLWQPLFERFFPSRLHEMQILEEDIIDINYKAEFYKGYQSIVTDYMSMSCFPYSSDAISNDWDFIIHASTQGYTHFQFEMGRESLILAMAEMEKDDFQIGSVSVQLSDPFLGAYVGFVKNDAPAPVFHQNWSSNLSLEQQIKASKRDQAELKEYSKRSIEHFKQKYSVTRHKWALFYLFSSRTEDKSSILDVAAKDYQALRCASLEMRSCPKIVIAFVSSNGLALQHAANHLQADSKIAKAALISNSNAYEFISPSIINESFLLEVCAHNPRVLVKLPESLTKKRSFMMSAIKNNKHAFSYVPSSLKLDKTFLKEALVGNRYLFDLLPQRIREDQAFILDALSFNNQIFNQLPKGLQEDEVFIHKALLKNEYVFELLPSRFRRNQTFAKVAVSKNGLLIKNVDLGCRYEKDIMLSALKQNPNALSDIGIEYNQVKPSWTVVSIQNWAAIYNLNELPEEKERIFNLIASLGHSDLFKYAPHHLCNNPKLVTLAAQKNIDVLSHVSTELRANKTFMLELIKQNSAAYQYASNELKQDRAFWWGSVHPLFSIFFNYPNASKSIITGLAVAAVALWVAATASLAVAPAAGLVVASTLLCSTITFFASRAPSMEETDAFENVIEAGM